jgi:hypothetical protein
MAVTDDFLVDGPGAPAGWTQSILAGGDTASLSVSNSRAHINLPSGIARDSIASTGGSDTSAGFTHPLPDHGGNIDIAVQLDTDITDLAGLGFNILMSDGAGGDARGAWHKPTSTSAYVPRGFMYTRAAGAGAAAFNANISQYQSGIPAWLRQQYDAATNTWRWFDSSDGFTWSARGSAVRAFNATMLKISATNAAATPASVMRINQVVDVIAAGTADLRSLDLLERNRQTVSRILGTDGALPTGWVDESYGGDSVTWTGTAMRLTDVGDLEVRAANSARIRYTGQKLLEFGMYLRCVTTTSSSSCFLTPGFTNGTQESDWNDQYTVKSGYAQEVQITTIRRPIRVDDPSDGNVAVPPESSSTGLDETPYCWLKDLTATTLNGNVTNFRFERNRTSDGHYRYRAKWWLASEAEPDVWNLYDGQDEVNDMPLGPYLSLSRNALTDSLGVVDVFELEYYELASSGDSVFEPIELGDGSRNDCIMAGLVSQGFTSGTIADRERARLLAKLELSPPVEGYSLYDLYRTAAEQPRLF